MSDYAADAADVLATLAEEGGPVTLYSATPRQYNEDTGQWIGGDPISTTSSAIQLEDNPMRLQTRNLVISNPLTLMMAAAGMAFAPAPLMTVQWGDRVATVRDVEPFVPDGRTPIYYTVTGGA